MSSSAAFWVMPGRELRDGVGPEPGRLRVDQELEFCAEAVRTTTLALDIDFSLATEYTPSENGKIERLHGTCVRTPLSGLPCDTPGAAAPAGACPTASPTLMLGAVRGAVWRLRVSPDSGKAAIVESSITF